MKHKPVSSFWLIVFFSFCLAATSPITVNAQSASPSDNSTANGGTPTTMWSIEKISQTIQTAEADKEKSRQAESSENAHRIGISLEQMQQRTRRWADLEAVLKEVRIESEKRVDLEKELAEIKQLSETFQREGLAQKPPYSIDTYDQVMSKLDTLGQTAKTSDLALATAKKNAEQALDQWQDAQKQTRQLKEQFEKDTSPQAQWRAQEMQIELRISEARYQLEHITTENIKIEQQITAEQERLLQRQASWIKSKLQYNPENFLQQQRQLEDKRKALEKSLADLLMKKKKADQQWDSKQAELQKLQTEQTTQQSFVLQQSLLKGADRWRKTYQIAIDQTSEMLGLIDQQEMAWQRRYALLKELLKHSVLIDWDRESAQQLEALERLLFIEQQRQNDLWREISSAQALSDKTADPSLLEAYRIEYRALQELASHGMDYMAAIASTQKIERRLKDEIEAQLQKTPIRSGAEKVWGHVKAVWNYEFWVIDDQPMTVKKVLVALVILVVGIMIIKIMVRRLAEKILQRPQVKATTAAAIEKLLLYISYLLVVLFALRMVNIPLTAFAFFGGAIAIGLGFGAQNLINNFISGFIIMGEQPISIGDLIEVDGLLGEVEEVGARCTRIRTGENKHILVPNSSFLEKNITNWTLSDRNIRASVTVGVVYGSPVDDVKKLLLDICNEFDTIHRKPEPFVLFTEFGDNALIFEVHFWITVKRVLERRFIESQMRFRIDDVFREANIIIAFPQRDVHLDTTAPLQIKLLDNQD